TFNIDTKKNCSALWDHLNCWPPSVPGQTVSQPCPDFFNSDGKIHLDAIIHTMMHGLIIISNQIALICFEGQTVKQASETHMYFSYVKTMYTVGYALSLISLTIAITIFCLFRKLHCTRNYIHIQLFLSFILRAIFIFIRDSMLFTNEELYHCDYYPVACKVVLMFSNYSILANYSWLLSEGHYLFTLITRSFFSLKKHLVWYIILSWGKKQEYKTNIMPTSPSAPDHNCEYLSFWHFLIDNTLFKCLSIIFIVLQMNVIFFLGILRIIVNKLRMPDAQRNELKQYKRLIKSTFFLVALFGLQYIVFAFLPTIRKYCLGFVVAVLYCFLNGEVQHEIQRRWRRWRMTRLLPSRPRQYRGSISQSGSPLTQVSMLPCSPSVTQTCVNETKHNSGICS
uniref:Secretin receptor n=1 Tax=Periophthalmus magnuspinnatus TaxID=409849 RepID=A0A3B4B5E7_9GOBI